MLENSSLYSLASGGCPVPSGEKGQGQESWGRFGGIQMKVVESEMRVPQSRPGLGSGRGGSRVRKLRSRVGCGLEAQTLVNEGGAQIRSPRSHACWLRVGDPVGPGCVWGGAG